MLGDGDTEMIRACFYQGAHGLAQDTEMPSGHQRARGGLLGGQVGQASILEWVPPRQTPQEEDMGSGHLFGRQFQGAQ